MSAVMEETVAEDYEAFRRMPKPSPAPIRLSNAVVIGTLLIASWAVVLTVGWCIWQIGKSVLELAGGHV